MSTNNLQAEVNKTLPSKIDLVNKSGNLRWYIIECVREVLEAKLKYIVCLLKIDFFSFFFF